MRQGFKTEELKSELERTLRFELGEFRRISDVNSLNFKAVRKSDGLAFLVKCLPPERQADFTVTVRHLAEMRGTRAVQRIFERECPEELLGVKVLCLEWCGGRNLFPDELTDGEFRRFLEDHLEFSDALQRTTLILPGYTPKEWRDGAEAACRGIWGGVLRRMLAKTPEEECCYRPEKLRVIHGDLHPGNFAFKDGCVAAYFDVMSFAWGYPALDLVRYFGFAAEHLPRFHFVRRHRLFRRFAEAVRNLPYPADEWIIAINATWMERIDKKLADGIVRPLALLKLAVAGRLYRKLRRIVRAELGPACG